MKEFVAVLVAGLMLAGMAAAEEKAGYVLYFEFSLNRSDQLAVKEVRIVEGEPTVGEEEGVHSVRLLGLEGKVLYTLPFNITWVQDGMEQDPVTGEVKDRHVERYISEQAFNLPYYTEADKIGVYHGSKKIFSRDVRSLTCKKNNRCEGDEDVANCPEDCTPRAVPVPTKTVEGKPPIETPPQEFPWLLLGVFVVLIAILAFLLMRRGRKKEENAYDAPFQYQ